MLEGDILDGTLYFENEDGSELDEESAYTLARLFNNNPERLMWLKMQPGQTAILEETVSPSENIPPPRTWVIWRCSLGRMPVHDAA